MPEPITVTICSDCGELVDDPDTAAGPMFGTTTTWEDHLADGCGPQAIPTVIVDKDGNLVVAQYGPSNGTRT